jgi:hypothetical protein
MTAQLGTPRGKYDEHSSKSSLSKKPRFIAPVGERTNFRRLMLASFVTAYAFVLWRKNQLPGKEKISVANLCMHCGAL